jgi:RNA polymerase sigma-70 factor (sigma-E family)
VGSQADAEFVALVRRRWDVLVRTAVLLGVRPAEAEDVVQTALIRCYRHWDRVGAADNRDGYVHRVLVNTVIDAARRRSWHETPVEAMADADPAAPDDPDLRLDLARRLAGLPEGQRAAIVLRFYLDLSERETAAVLGIAPGTVKSRVARALGALANDAADRPERRQTPWTS